MDAVPEAEKVAFLARPGSYPRPTRAVRVVETHMSWVFVTDELVYKMKKPVRLAFLDFSTLALRRHYCGESLRLNRRLAPGVYVDVVPLIREASGSLRVEGEGAPVEWLEKMRRLPEERMLDYALRRGTVTAERVRAVAEVLSRFYACQPSAERSAQHYRARLNEELTADQRALADPAYHLDDGRLRRVSRNLMRFLDHNHALLDARVSAGRVVEAHGDLRPEHVCLTYPPVIIDCLEFNRTFRIMDPADEMAYLAMECELLGGGFVGGLLFHTYGELSGDRVPESLVRFHAGRRALLRAKLAAWHLPDQPAASHGRWLSRAAAYLALAQRHADALRA